MSRSPYSETRPLGLAHNMSAPPRSTVSFRPYGTAQVGSTASTTHEEGGNLRWVFRAQVDLLLKARRLAPASRNRPRRHTSAASAPTRAPEGQSPQAEPVRTRGRPRTAEAGADPVVRARRLAGLVLLAAEQASEPGLPGLAALAGEPAEALLDRLADLAGRLPPPQGLPALAVAEPASDATPKRAGSPDVLAVLWVLTHINGHTFDRDGLPLLVPDLAAGGIWDLYAC